MSPVIRATRDRLSESDLNRSVSVLNDDGVIIAPADTVYGLVAKAFSYVAFERLDRIKGDRSLPYVIAFDSLSSVKGWFGCLDLFRKRVLETLLPGPVTLILSTDERTPNGFRYGEAGIGIRVSSDSLYPQLSARLGSPIWATSANRSGEPAPVHFGGVTPALIREVDLAIDSGPTIFRQTSTVIDLRRHPFRVVREGPWMPRVEQAIARAAEPLEVLVVCTGNICRSPLIAGLLGARLGQPEACGLKVSSAGTNAVEGRPATPETVSMAHNLEFDLSPHRSRQLRADMLRDSDVILAAEPEHRDYILNLDPEVVDRVALVGEPAGVQSIPDPYGSLDEYYQQTGELIQRAVDGWAERLREMIRASGWRGGASDDFEGRN